MRATRRKAGVVGVVVTLAVAGATAAFANGTASTSGNTPPPVTGTDASLDEELGSTAAADVSDAASAGPEQESANNPSEGQQEPNERGGQPANTPAAVQPLAHEQEDDQAEEQAAQEEDEAGEQGQQEDDETQEQAEQEDDQAQEQAEQEDDQAGDEGEHQDEQAGDERDGE